MKLIMCVFLMSVSIVAPVAGSERWQQANDRLQPTAADLYAQLHWINLNEILPSDARGIEVYVRLVAIDGEVLLPVDHGR